MQTPIFIPYPPTLLCCHLFIQCHLFSLIAQLSHGLYNFPAFGLLSISVFYLECHSSLSTCHPYPSPFTLDLPSTSFDWKYTFLQARVIWRAIS